MITVRTCIPTDAPTISNIAMKTWWSTYGPILSKEQISFMLKENYDPIILKKSIEEGIGFMLAEKGTQAVGFIAFQEKENSSTVYRIDKLYIIEQAQGLGIGKILINAVSSLAIANGYQTLELNVNRKNPAHLFYEKQGFSITEEVDIPYFEFILNDYIMQKAL